ncbi:DUF1806 domain-containing protein, partial [Staphylococcus aureus]
MLEPIKEQEVIDLLASFEHKP